MYASSREHVFARVERIRLRAAQLIQGPSAPPPPAESDEVRRVAQSLAAQVDLRLPTLAGTFALDPLAVDALLCLVAAEYDPFMRSVLRALQREAGRPWMELGTLAELLELPPQRVPDLAALFDETGALRRSALVHVDDSAGVEIPAVNQRVKIASRIARFLVGDDALPTDVKRVVPRPLLAESLVPAAEALRVTGRIRRALLDGEPLLVEVTGAPGTGKRRFVEGLAAELGVELLVIDLAPVEARRLAERLAEARREQLLTGGLLCLAHWSAHLPSPTPRAEEPASGLSSSAPSTPRRVPLALARFLEESRGVLFITGEESEPLLETHAASIAHVDVPYPSPSQRALLLEKALRSRGATWSKAIDLAQVTRRFALDPARIEAAARSASDLVRLREPEAEELSHSDLVAACRHQLRHDLKSLAARVTATHKWEDLVIPVDVYHSLHEMIAYLRHAARVYDDWGFGARHGLTQGVSALFAGPPGTGKTMCASVIARELDMELFRVDLSRVVSKWIGETEKNLGKVFDEAQRSHAIILFDEADSLFAKRTEVKSSVDRYANLEVNFLLQRMEAFSGVTILTTNFEDTIDTAFKRRLTFRMRFEKPDAAARAALWRKVFPASCALAPDFDAERLGARFEISGGNIRNAAVRAAFLAASAGHAVDMATCVLAAERESREMGLLTPSPVEIEEEAGPEPDDEEPAPQKPMPRLVPITHPRRSPIS